MAKQRAPLTFDQVKATKPVPSVVAEAAPAPDTIVPTPEPEPRQNPRRGRPPKARPKGGDATIYGLTFRVPSDVRKRLRRAAEIETDRQGGRVVSVNDVILSAVEAYLDRKGIKTE